MHGSAGGDYRKFLGAVCLLYIGVVLVAQTLFIADPTYFHEEQRPLFRYLQLHDSNLFAGDYLASVVSASRHPYLYDAITRLWLWAGGDLVILHRLLPIFCWLSFLAGLAVAARSLGDGITILGAVCVAVAQPIYLHQIAAASPHAFAFPLLVWGLAALLHGSTRGLVFCTLLSALLYTAMAPLLGLLLAWHMLVMRRFLASPRADQFKALLLLAITGAAALWLVLDSLKMVGDFGAALEPMQKVDLYPENGPEGRHFLGVFNPMLYVLGKALVQFHTSNLMLALAVLLALAALALFGLFSLAKGSATRKALFGFILCSAVLWTAIYLVKPYHSYRFVFYPLFVFLPLLSVVGLQQVCRRLQRLLRFPDIAAVAVLVPLVLAFDSGEPEKAGYRWHLDPQARQVIDFAAGTAADSLFAVWPGGESELELIPYLAGRPLFVMEKVHYPIYEDHILKMRARMQALIDAYLAAEETPLRDLHCRWGVDYLVAEKAHFGEDARRPEYFAPFDSRIEEIWQSSRQDDFLLRSPAPALVALETERYLVVRLPGPCEPD